MSANTGGSDERLRPDLRRLLVGDSSNLAGGSYVRVLCPFHGDRRKASGSVYEDHFFCYTCGAWVPRFEFLRVIGEGAVTARGVVSNGDSNQYLPPRIADDYAHILWTARKDRLEWFRQRGLTDETIRAARLGHTGRAFSIPILGGGMVSLAPGQSRLSSDAEGLSDPPMVQAIKYRHDPAAIDFGNEGRRLVAIKYRSDPYYDTCEDECTCPKYWGVKGRNRGLLFDPSGGSLRSASGYCVLTEGELDALLLHQNGIPAVSHINGSKPELSTFAPLRALSEVVVAYDADKAGQTGALRVRDYLGNARIVTWNIDSGKDVTELIQRRGIDYFRRLARI